MKASSKEMIGLLTALGVAQTMKAEGGATCLLAGPGSGLARPLCNARTARSGSSRCRKAYLNQPEIDALALVLGELALNSTKHGALVGRAGDVTAEDAVGRRASTLRWSERSDAYHRTPRARGRTGPAADDARPRLARRRPSV